MILGRKFHFDSAHCLKGHPKCGQVHGHTWHLTVEVEGQVQLNGMVMDLHDLKAIVEDCLGHLDHQTIKLDPPTCEIISSDLVVKIANKLPKGIRLHSLKLQEGEGGYARWIR